MRRSATKPTAFRLSALYQLALLMVMLAVPSAHGQCTAQALQLAQQQLTKTLNYIDTSHFASYTVLNSKTNYSRWNSVAATDWTSGFLPGWIWYMYQQTLDPSLLSRAQSQTASLLGETTDASGHDIGFRILLSYGNGYGITRDPSYMSAVQTAAQTMSTLYVSFPDGSGSFNSWPWYSSYTNTIIDNMMNIELPFYAAKNGGNSAWYNMAVNHALKTMQNLVRSDGSTYQGVEYNSDGSVHTFFTNDGYSVSSTWSRGQAWGIYGFTMAYRYTGNAQFLTTAQALANYFIANLPPDYVPYWDFHFSTSNPSYRDTSAAAIAAAGLLELNGYVGSSNNNQYFNAAMQIQNSLSSSYYQGNPLNTDGILLHGTDSLPNSEAIDTSLVWGDYYFIQGCYRAMTPPAQVTGLAVGTVSYNGVPLSWQAQSGALRYNVKRSSISGGPYTVVAPPPVLTANSYIDSSVSANASYYYVVSASTAAGEGPNSAEIMVQTPTAPADFSLSASPASLSVSQSSSTSSTVAVRPTGSFTGTVSLTASNTSGLKASFSPAAIVNGSGTSVMTVTAGGVPAGTYPLTVAAASGSLLHSTPVSVTVVPGGSFVITANPASLTVSKSSSPTAPTALTVTSSNGFNGIVHLSVGSLPRGISATLSASSLSVSPASAGTATLTVTVNQRSSTGSSNVTVTGSSSGLHQANIEVPLHVKN